MFQHVDASNEARQQDGESVKSVCMFVCNIITDPWVMMKTQERERATDGKKSAVCEFCFYMCVWSSARPR